MKLHLPKLLTAALIAAVTAVGSSAFADGETEFTTTNLAASSTTQNYNAKGFVVVLNGPRLTTTPTFTGNLVYLDSLTLGSLRAVPTGGVTLALADANGNVLSLSENIVSTANEEVTWTFSNTTVATDSSLYFYWLDASKGITVGKKLADSDLASWTNAGNGSNGVSDYNSIAAVASNNSSCGYLDSLSHIQTANIRFAPKLSIVTSGPVPQNEYTWKATGTTALWDEVATNWTLKDEESRYKSSATNIVDFNAGGEFAKNVTVRGSISAATVNVNDDYQFTVESGSSLTIDKLSVADEKTVSVAGEGSVTLSKVALADKATINVGTATNMAVTADGDATINATAATTITSLTGPAAGKTLNLGGSNVLTITSANEFAGNVNVTGGTVKLGSSTALGKYNTDGTKEITIGAGGTVDTNGQVDANYYYVLAGGTLTNTGAGKAVTSSQTTGLKLTDNSYIGSEGQNEMWVACRSHVDNTITLNNYTLTKNGNGLFGFKNSAITAGTLQINAGTVKLEGGSIAANVVLNGGVITGTLTPSANIDITAKESTTISNLTFSIAADKTVTLKTDAEKAISFSGDLGLATGGLDVQGTVNVSSNIDLSKNGVSTAKLSLKDGSVTTAAGMWMASTASLLMEDGAVLNIAGLQIEGTADGGISTTAANEQYGTGKAVFTISNATVTSTGDDVTLGNTLSGVDVFVAEGSSLTLNTNADSVTVRNGGTFTLNEGKNVDNITVENGGTIAGGVEAQDVTIEAKGTATFEQGVDDNQNYVSYFGSQDADVQVTNNSEEAAPYRGIGDANMTVRAATLFAASGEHVTVENQVIVNSIYNVGDAVTISHVDTKVLDSISNEGGQVTLMNVETDPVELSNLLTTEKTVAVYQGADESTEGTIVISDTLYGGSGTLLANLEMLDNSTLDLAVAITEGTTSEALTLGSAFTMQEGVVVNLDSTTLADIAALADNEKKTLIVGLQDTTLTTNLQNGDWASTHFNLSGINGGDYKVFVENNSIGIMKASNVPEPTTGTLSLLALMALAARRRRK